MITLKNILLANATSCILFGIFFLLYPADTATFLSTEKTAANWIIQILGAGLILNSFHLSWVAFKNKPLKNEVLHFAIGDIIWVVATIALILTGTWITSTDGIIFSLIVALVVGVFAALQFILLPPK